MKSKQQIVRQKSRELISKGAYLVAPGEKYTNGVPTGRDAIIIGVPKKVPKKDLSPCEIIPQAIDGVETDVIEFEPPTILPPPKVINLNARTSKQRPAVGGISCGHPDITAGTIGGIVWKDGQRYAITNWHVGNMNDGKIDDLMLQPGPYDGGTMKDSLGRIVFKPYVHISGTSTCPIAAAAVKLFNAIARFTGSCTRMPNPVRVQSGENLVDMCLFGPLDVVQMQDIVYEMGLVNTKRWKDFSPGEKATKSGRTTGVTMFDCEYINATVRVGLDGNQFAVFDDVDVFGYGSAGGDSGSLILHQSETVGPVGALLFAGSKTSTIGCAWRNVRVVGGLD